MRRSLPMPDGWHLFFAVVMTVIVCLLTRQILVWMQTPDNIIDGAYSYIFFVFAGIPATYLYNTLAGIVRAWGTPRTPFSDFISLANIVLDLFHRTDREPNSRCCFYATVIAQAVSGILCLIYMKKKFDILKCIGRKHESIPTPLSFSA